MEKQRVVVIQDVSREVNPSPVRWALDGFLLKPGDKLTLVGVLHQVITPMGYKTMVDTCSMVGASQKIVEEATARKEEEYQRNEELAEIRKLYEEQKVEFKIEIIAGPSLIEITLEAAKNLKATRVILDRQMKKDKKYFLKKLSCGISRTKRDNTIEELRGPKAPVPSSRPTVPTQNGNNCNINSDDTVARSSLERGDVFSIELPAGTAEKEEVSQTDQEVTSSTQNNEHLPKVLVQRRSRDVTCMICRNVRPNIECKRDFTYEELHASTEGFSPQNSLSDGEFMHSFRGQLENELKIVVKRINPFVGKEDFESKVNVLSKARHKNVIQLLGSCWEGDHRFLVYEYACNGLLSTHISEDSPKPLSWTERIEVAVGASRGLCYLHENRTIHRDLSSDNILLTHDFEPLVGYFGLAETKYDSDDSSEDMIYFDYQAPERAENGTVSSKTDVYSFGVVLLELITGKIAATRKETRETNVLRWARPLLRNRRYLELLDPRLADDHDPEQLVWMVEVALRCLEENPKKRLTMDRVVSALEFISESKSCNNMESEMPL